MSLKRAWLAVPAALALSLGACASGGDTTTSGSTQSADTAASPTSSTGIVLVNGSEPQNPLIPANTNEVGGGRILDIMFAGLIYYDAEGNVVNEMAESIKTDDSIVFTVTLKADQKFSDGTPVTSSSFVDAWKMAASQKMMSINFFAPILGADEEGAGDLTGLEVIDDTTFTITLKQAEADFPLRLGYSAFYPLPQSTLDDTTTGGENPIGNGPYMLAAEGAWVHNEKLDLIPNPEYTGDRVAKNGGVSFLFYQDASAAYNDLLAGSLDVLDQIPDDAVATFEDELGDRAINQVSALNQNFTIPESLAHFSGEEGKLRREAISYSINREEITTVIFNGTRSPAQDFTTPVVPGSASGLAGSEVLSYDPEKAKELWAKADAISPWDGTFQIAYNADGPHREWVEAVTNQISNTLGITASGDAKPDFKSLRDPITNHTITTAFRSGWQADYPSAFNFLAPLFQTGAGANDGQYSNPAFDKLLTEASAATSFEDSQKSLDAAQEILFQDLPVIPLWNQNGFGGFSENVSNVTFDWKSVPVYYQIVKN